MLGLQSELRTVADPETLSRVMEFHACTCFFFDQKLFGRVGIRQIPAALSDKLSRHDLWMFTESETIELPECDASPWCRDGSAEAFQPESQVSSRDLAAIVRGAFFTRNPDKISRFYPSAGALFPIQVFVCVVSPKKRSRIDSGIYHVLPRRRALEVVAGTSKDILLAPLERGGLPPELRPSLYFIYAINFDVAIFKYGFRGYRFALMEAGAIAQQAELVARERGIASRMWGGFSDHEVARLCRMNPTVLAPVIIQLMGRKRADRQTELRSEMTE